MMGYTSQEGYEHESSKAIRGDVFCGLLLDAVNQEELTEGRVKKWVEQLKAEGILAAGGNGGVTTAPVAESVSHTPKIVEAQVISAVSSNDDAIAKLERENAALRRKLEESSSLLDEAISEHSSDLQGYAPHFNPSTGRTMWTSSDGHSCYYTISSVNPGMLP